MAQYLKPDSVLGYIEDNAEIENLKINNLRHTVLGCMLGDFNDVGAYVVSPEIVKELIEMEKHIVQVFDNIELCRSNLKLDKQISFMVTFEGNRATLALVEKMNYEANFAINSGTYSDINEYILDSVETNGEINRNALYARWNIKTTPGNALDIFNCDESVLAKYFGIVDRFKYLLKANTILLEKEEMIEEIEAEYSNEMFRILSHYPKLKKEVIKTIKANLEEKKNSISAKKPYFAKTLNEVIENAISKNIEVLEEKEQNEFAQEKHNAVVSLNIKREDVIDVQKTKQDEEEFAPSLVVVKTPQKNQDDDVVDLARTLVAVTNRTQRRLEGSEKVEEESVDLLQRARERVLNANKDSTGSVGEKEKPKRTLTPERQKLEEYLIEAELSDFVGIPSKQKKDNKETVKSDDGKKSEKGQVKKPVANSTDKSSSNDKKDDKKAKAGKGTADKKAKDTTQKEKPKNKKEEKETENVTYLGGLSSAQNENESEKQEDNKKQEEVDKNKKPKENPLRASSDDEEFLSAEDREKLANQQRLYIKMRNGRNETFRKETENVDDASGKLKDVVTGQKKGNEEFLDLSNPKGENETIQNSEETQEVSPSV